MRDEFLAIAAHELRTPLTPLKMQLEMMTRRAGGSTSKGPFLQQDLSEMLERSKRQVDRLLAVVEEVLDTSTSGVGGLHLTAETTDLSEVVCDVVQHYQTELERAACTVELHAESEVVGLWDRMRLEQVVVNLLTNAMKYGAGKPIEIEVSKSGAQAKLTVRDHGIGIEAKDRDRIFERFERAVSVRHFGGFGLGLYIAREIVRAHGGSIGVESLPGVGSTFTVILPLESQAVSIEADSH